MYNSNNTLEYIILSIGSHTQNPPHPNIELAQTPPIIIAMMFIFVVNIIVYLIVLSIAPYCIANKRLVITDMHIRPINKIGGCIADI
jgi:hypothetical protein